MTLEATLSGGGPKDGDRYTGPYLPMQLAFSALLLPRMHVHCYHLGASGTYRYMGVREYVESDAENLDRPTNASTIPPTSAS